MARPFSETPCFGETDGRFGLAEDLFQALPKLQHYTVCLIGSKEAADRWIEEVLMDIVESNIVLDGSSITVSLFKAFHRTQHLEGLYRFLRPHERTSITAIEEAVLSLSSNEHCAALLADVIGFSDSEVAEILDIPSREVSRVRTAASDIRTTHFSQTSIGRYCAFGGDVIPATNAT